MALLTCRNVTMAYESTVACENVNFDLSMGSYLLIVGENGSGKSTLMKGLVGLKAPKSGEILGGREIAPGHIGYLPQQTAVQKDFPASVFEVVLSGRLAGRGWKPFYTRADKEEAGKNMKLLGIENLKKRCYRELSGGQQQRVLLARALCSAKSVLFLDEPAAGLDPLVTQELYRVIEKINKELGMTIVMVSHDMQSAVPYASHILHMKKQPLFCGTREEYVNSQLGKRYVGGGEHDV